ncbi:DegT/DnrJ/EryC1/StrS family aminotransferase [Amycolatopsis sp. NPDC049253]|uniref:DegT/DnrJ/EryC1/StrS family aminotransferase n=1 Tax=Amycolatopsis sp. NPDC049253 TaxID=3155274 RepID=UPI003432DDF4
MTKLAMFGGTRTVGPPKTLKAGIGWPVVTAEDEAAVAGVLSAGLFTSNDAGRGEVSWLQRDWAEYVGTRHCAAVVNGTAALELALAALDLEPGSEVLVPSLTFIGSAVPVVQRLLVPVFVDVDPVTFTMNPDAAAAAITPRTRAIMAVHLHGVPCDLTRLSDLAERHDLHLIEDAAQAHGATHLGRRVGSIGDINASSLNVTKNLPTCGEGGLVTTDSDELHEQVVLRRQFGESLEAGRERDYLSRVLAGNLKLSAVQAAFARSQLERLPEYDAARARNVEAFLARLAELPGVVVPTCPPDRTHAWHILRMRLDPEAAGIGDVPAGPFRAVVQRALRAEGVPVQPYQIVPLPGQRAFRDLIGLGGGYPWRLPGARHVDYRAEDHPTALAVIEDSVTIQRWHLNPAAGPVLDACADAFAKVWRNLDTLAGLARSLDYRAPWHAAEAELAA